MQFTWHYKYLNHAILRALCTLSDTLTSIQHIASYLYIQFEKKKVEIKKK